MNWTAVQRILGLLLMMFSLTMLPPIVIDIIFDENSWLPFVRAFGLTLAAMAFPLLKSSPRDRIPWYDWVLVVLGVVTILYMLVLLVFYCIRGNPGPNRFG